MGRPAEIGAGLGVRIAQIGSKIREESLARTTPALVQLASRVADAEARKRAEAMFGGLESWLETHASASPLPGWMQSLGTFLLKQGGLAAQQAIATAIGFGVGTALAATLEPWFNDMTQAAWRTNPSALLAPGTLADAVARGWEDLGPALEEARSQGLVAERFRTLMQLATTVLSGNEVLELYRRGEIDEAEADLRLHHAGLGEDGRALVLKLRTILHAPDEALQAELQGQLEHGAATKQYQRAGGDPRDYEWRFNIRGTAPTPVQALELLNRGIIGERGAGPSETSYEQAFLEGPWRNKWLEPFLALREYVVPPRSVVPMVRSGAWTPERGVEELTRSGVPAETAQAMLEEAAAGKLEPEHALAKSEVLAAYRDGFLRSSDALDALGALGYGPDEADLLLAIEDHRWERSFRDSAISRIRTLYVGRKVTESEAADALAGIGAGGRAGSKFLALWDVERDIPAAELTEAQVRAAWRARIVDEDYYRRWLGGKGYSPEEVEILVGLYRPA